MSKKEKFRLGLGAEFFVMSSQRKRKPRLLKGLGLVHKCNYNARTYTISIDEGQEMHITASMITVRQKGGKLLITVVKPFSMVEGVGLALKNSLGVMHRDTLVIRKLAESVTIEPHTEVSAFFKGNHLNVNKVKLIKSEDGIKWISV